MVNKLRLTATILALCLGQAYALQPTQVNNMIKANQMLQATQKQASNTDTNNQNQKVEKPTAPMANTAIGKLASNGYALVFVFESGCPYCQRMTPNVEKLSQQYGFIVYPFSADGKGLGEYKYPLPVTEKVLHAYFDGADSLYYPVLILQNVNNMEWYPVANGFLDLDKVETILNGYSEELLK